MGLSGWLKATIAATCIVVVAAVGFWTWKLLSDEAEAKRLADARALAAECEQIVEGIKTRRGDYTLGHMITCIRGGALSVEDLDRRGLGHIATQVREYEANFPAT